MHWGEIMTLQILRAATLAGASLAIFSTAAFGAIEIVTVTAEKRSENVQDVPIAVSAYSGNQLKAAQIHDVNDLQQVSPSLIVSTGSGETSGALIRMRGVGTTGNNAGLEAAVGVFIDGVYRNRSAAAMGDLNNIERIEVLRGPQGTLFGKNTSAGALSIITRKPSFDRNIEVSASGGSLSTYGFTALASDGLSDALAVSLAGTYSHRDGYLKDVNDGHTENGRNRFSLQAQALWTPISDIVVRLIADFSQRNENGSGAGYSWYDTRTSIIQAIAATHGKVLAVPYTGPAFNGSTQDSGLGFINYKNYKIADNFPTISDANNGGISGQLDWNLSENVALTSISAYRQFWSNDGVDTDYSPINLLGGVGGAGIATTRTRDDVFTQEVQLKGTAGWFDWLLGGYYANERIAVGPGHQQAAGAPAHWGVDANEYWARIAQAFLTLNGNPGQGLQLANCIRGLPNTYTATGPGTAGAVACAPGGAGGGAGAFPATSGYTNAFKQSGSTWSVFTHDVIKLSDQVSLTLGARYTGESKKASESDVTVSTVEGCGAGQVLPTALQAAPNVLCSRTNIAAFPALLSRSEAAFTGTANLTYKPTDMVMMYASYSRGYKAGGFNLNRDATQPGSTIQFKPETVDAFEAGIKTTLFDGMATANLAVFDETFKNFQFNTFNGLGFLISNAASVKDQGFEFEGVLAPTEGLELTAAATFASAIYGPNSSIAAASPPATLANNTITQAPRWTLNGGVNYETPLSELGVVGFVNADVNYRTKYITGSDLNPLKTQPAFALMNARVGVKSTDDMWELAVWGRNVLNEHYNIVAFNTPFQGSTTAFKQNISVFPGEPAVYGLTLSLHY